MGLSHIYPSGNRTSFLSASLLTTGFSFVCTGVCNVAYPLRFVDNFNDYLKFFDCLRGFDIAMTVYNHRLLIGLPAKCNFKKSYKNLTIIKTYEIAELNELGSLLIRQSEIQNHLELKFTIQRAFAAFSNSYIGVRCRVPAS